MTEQQQATWIYTWERIALVQTILNGGAAALVAALKAEESYMLRQIYLGGSVMSRFHEDRST